MKKFNVRQRNAIYVGFVLILLSSLCPPMSNSKKGGNYDYTVLLVADNGYIGWSRLALQIGIITFATTGAVFFLSDSGEDEETKG